MQQFFHPEILRVLNQIEAQYAQINDKLEVLIMSQSDVDAATAALTGAATTLTAVAADLGALSSRFESRGDAGAVGYDPKGGYSYGQYQIASLTGTLGSFLRYLQTATPAAYGALNAAGYPTLADGSVPDQLRGHILARTTWLFLADFAALKSMATENRKIQADKAEAMLEKIAERKAGAIESPGAAAGPTGNWNSEPRLVMRTHPIPSPAQQTGTGGKYANPNAPGD
jgi:hypothetical protein